jgi:hypothetical protein
MARALLLAVLLATVAAAPALADCVDEVAKLKPRVARERDPQIAGPAKRELARAQEQLQGSETECRNAVTRAWRILKQPPATADAKGGKQGYSYVPYNAREETPVNTPRR